MKRLFFVLLLCMFFLFPPDTHAQDAFATCDACGYCKDRQVPQNWVTCKQCLYDTPAKTYSDDATTNETLKLMIDSDDPTATTKVPPKIVPGKFYTMIGCINTNFGGTSEGFTSSSAAGSVIQRLLTVIFSIAGGIAFLYFIYGSFLILTTQNDPERLNHGKRVIIGSLIGVAFTLSSVFILNLIGNNILKIPGFGG